MGDILTGTPPILTYDHDFIRQARMVVWAVTSGALVMDVAHPVSQFIAYVLDAAPGDLLCAPLDPMLTAVMVERTSRSTTSEMN